MKIFSYFKSAKVLLVAVLAGICGLISPMPSSNADAKLVSQRQYVLDEAFITGQGLANDGEYFYSSGAMSAFYMTALAKIDAESGEVVKKNLSALPVEFTKKGYDHIGAISVYGDTIYAPVEDRAEERPLVLLFDKNTLEYTGTYYELDAEYLPDGIPWCAVDSDSGLLYTSPFRNSNYILAFNLKDMSFAKKIDLSEAIDRVQAGVYFDGKLYVNLDPNTPKGKKVVRSIDLASGEVADCFTRNVTGAFGCETEGITIRITPDGKMQFVIADYDKTVCVFMRTYELLK